MDSSITEIDNKIDILQRYIKEVEKKLEHIQNNSDNYIKSQYDLIIKTRTDKITKLDEKIKQLQLLKEEEERKLELK